jgi:CBS domain-containing protein/uncharacterized protein (DUF2267 family)
MSLRWYVRPRMVVLTPKSSALEAARAIANNNIGAVLVQDRGRVAGIVTDRDLAVRMVGQGLDPTSTTVADIMSTDVATLTPDDEQNDAVRLMYQRNVRRIPLVEDDRLVGIVTLDDLLLDEAAPLDRLAAVVKAQIGAGGPAPTTRSPRWRRSAARAEATYGRLLGQVREKAALETADEAETALEVVLESVVQRLTPDEADDLIAQLPSLLQPALEALPPGPDKSITRATIERELSRRLDVEPERAEQLLGAVGATIADSVSAGQMEDVRGQLPKELRNAFTSGEVQTRA